jgi:hypothetical protein
MPATYFVAYRYSQRGYAVDGNTVVTLDKVIENEDDVRTLEAYLAREKGVDSDDLGLISVSPLS